MSRPAMLGAAIALVIASIVPAAAQSPSAGPAGPGRLELGFGAGWTGGTSLGSRDANETSGTGSSVRLFSSSTDLASGAGFDAHVAFSVTRRLEVEAYLSYTQPQLQTRIDSDTETSNAPLTAADTIRQFAIGGAALWYLRPQSSGRLQWFVRGGIGGLRQLENDGTRIVTGREYEAGGGVKILFSSRSAGFWKGIGVRADARAVIRQKGVAFDDDARVSPAVGASIFVRF